MDKAFEALRDEICGPGSLAKVTDADVTHFASRCVVALAVGGMSSRMQAKTEPLGINKSALRLPTGETMLSRTICMYRDAGFKDFVALVSYQAQSIIDLLGNGDDLGVRITYSHDPGGPIGRGGAIRHALESTVIPRTHSLIVHNPDDVIVGYPGSFPADLVAAHVAGLERRMKATAVLTDGLPATYTGMKVQGGLVQEVMAYPKVPVPAHVGVTLFDPVVYPLFEELFSLSEKTDFEPVLFPQLVREGSLYSLFVPTESWVQVNDPKAWDKLVERLKSSPVL